MTSLNTGLSRCQPIPAPGAYSQYLLQAVGRHTGKRSHVRPQRKQERGNGISITQGSRCVVIAPAERDDTTLAKKAVKFERFEREAFEMLKQDAFLGGGNQIVTVSESRWEGSFGDE